MANGCELVGTRIRRQQGTDIHQVVGRKVDRLVVEKSNQNNITDKKD